MAERFVRTRVAVEHHPIFASREWLRRRTEAFGVDMYPRGRPSCSDCPPVGYVGGVGELRP
jgi:hypothetical protein